MMTGFKQINLGDMIDELGEDRVKSILADFSCPLNKDVADFLQTKSIEFAKKGLAATHLVFASYKNKKRLVGYYSIATKFITIDLSVLKNTLRKRISKFCQFNRHIKAYIAPAQLIAQLGKNYTDSLNNLISGDELLKMACDQVKLAQSIAGGRITYLECEDKQRLLEFYSANGFVNFGKRPLDKDEEADFQGKYLIQMLKYL